MKLPSGTQLLLLHSLGAREVSGRELAKLFEKEHGRSISYGTLYTSLRRLKEDGWVEVRDEETEDRRTKYFRLTGAGAAARSKVAELGAILAGKGVLS